MAVPIPLRGSSLDDGVTDFRSYVRTLADHRWLDRVTADLRRFMRLMRGRQPQLPGRMQASINEHRVLMNPFEQRDATRAERALHDHLLAQRVAFKTLRQPARRGRHAR